MHRQGPNGGPGALDVLDDAERIVRETIRRFDREAARAGRQAEKTPLLEASFYQNVTLVTVIAHQADAHWAAGNREEAVKRWESAALIADTFSLIDRPFPVPESVVRDYTAEAELCRAKVRAANEDRDPLAVLGGTQTPSP